MSLGPLAIVLLLPLLVVIGLRTHRWRLVAGAGFAAAVAALVFPLIALVAVVGALVSLMAGAVLVGTGVHAVGRPVGTVSVPELMVGGIAIHLWRRRQGRRWSGSRARRHGALVKGR